MRLTARVHLMTLEMFALSDTIYRLVIGLGVHLIFPKSLPPPAAPAAPPIENSLLGVAPVLVLLCSNALAAGVSPSTRLGVAAPPGVGGGSISPFFRPVPESKAAFSLKLLLAFALSRKPACSRRLGALILNGVCGSATGPSSEVFPARMRGVARRVPVVMRVGAISSARGVGRVGTYTKPFFPSPSASEDWYGTPAIAAATREWVGLGGSFGFPDCGGGDGIRVAE